MKSLYIAALFLAAPLVTAQGQLCQVCNAAAPADASPPCGDPGLYVCVPVLQGDSVYVDGALQEPKAGTPAGNPPQAGRRLKQSVSFGSVSATTSSGGCGSSTFVSASDDNFVSISLSQVSNGCGQPQPRFQPSPPQPRPAPPPPRPASPQPQPAPPPPPQTTQGTPPSPPSKFPEYKELAVLIRAGGTNDCKYDCVTKNGATTIDNKACNANFNVGICMIKPPPPAIMCVQTCTTGSTSQGCRQVGGEVFLVENAVYLNAQAKQDKICSCVDKAFPDIDPDPKNAGKNVLLCSFS